MEIAQKHNFDRTVTSLQHPAITSANLFPNK
jgi:hypothetical protein